MYIQSYGRPDECQFGRKNNKTQSHQTTKTVFYLTAGSSSIFRTAVAILFPALS